MKRIHIVSSGPRTGTTLMAEAMVACFNIDDYHEHEASICSTRVVSGNCYLTKNPCDLNSVYYPLLLNKDLFVICLIRDPRDTIVSTHGARPDIYYTGLRWWKLFVKKYAQLNSLSRFIPIKYEDLVRNPDQIQNNLLEKMPFLNKVCNFSEYHLVAQSSELSQKALKGIRPIKPKGIGKWKKHLPRVKQQIQIHGSISDDLITFGYENDKKWEKLLTNIEPGDYEQDRPEFLKLRERMENKKKEFYEVINILIRKAGLEPAKVYKPIKSVLKRDN